MKKIVVVIVLLLLISYSLSYFVLDKDDQDDKNKTIQIDFESTEILVPEWLNIWPKDQFNRNYINGIYVYDDYIYVSSYNSVLRKLDLEGNVIWNKTWKREDYIPKPNAVYVYYDKIYVSISVSKEGSEKIEETYLLIYDMEGNLLWNTTFGNEKDYERFSIVATDDAVYIKSHVRYNFRRETLLLKYDYEGNIIWNLSLKGYGGASISLDDDFFYLIGNSGGCLGDSDEQRIFLSKYDHDGELIWEQEWDMRGIDGVSSVILDSDSIYVGGYTCNGKPHGHHDALLLKFHKNGKLDWKLTWDIGNYTSVRSMFLYEDQIYLTGTTSFIHSTNYITLTKLTRDGEHIKTWLWDYSTSEFTTTIFVHNGSVYLGGQTGNDGFLLRFDE